ncbi:MAG TPA: pyridoxal phosphate-dependent aminotransferase [Bryobacteraceae bacterium]|nr:pyridoxal phosphate-dependent aminotransferase [Bryobacteraceae bacterium]
MRLTQAMSRIGVERAFDVLVRARQLEAQGRHVIHLEIGEPDFPTPAHIVEAAKKALDEGWTHYGPTQGYPELREAVAAYISRSRNIQVGPEHVSIVPGGKPIIFFSILALIEPGDEVIYPNPGFPIYESMINFAGGVPVPMPLVEERGFSLDLDRLRDSLNGRTRLLILNSPHNPTGGVIPPGDMRAIADMVRERDLMVLADEMYSEIWYDQPPVSITAFPGMLEKTILLDGFSKTFAMTGWRMGYSVAPTWLVGAFTKLMVNSNSCTSSFTQRAGIAALNGPQEDTRRMVAEFRRRRDAFCDGLNQLPGFRCARPGGAFYAFPNIQGTGRTAKELAGALLDEAGVACVEGTSFGEYGEGYIRFSYANSFTNLLETVERIRVFLSRT